VTEKEKEFIDKLEKRLYQFLEESNGEKQEKHGKEESESFGKKILGKRQSMGESVENILKREKFWDNWKDHP